MKKTIISIICSVALLFLASPVMAINIAGESASIAFSYKISEKDVSDMKEFKTKKAIKSLLEKYNVMVHFKLEYSLVEKYRFIVEEVFLQGVDEENKKAVKAFVYEDYHPEIISPLDEDEEF